MSICNANPEIWRQLQPRQKDEIYDVSLRILREIGVRVGSASVRKRLCSNGARVCGEIVYITDEMVSSALKTSPSVFKIYRTTGEDAMLLDGRSVYFGSGTDSVKYFDPYSGDITPCTRESARVMSILTEMLPNIDFIDAVGMISNIDARLGSRFAFSIALANTTKVLNFCADTAESYKDIIQLAADFSGGSENLKKKPFLFGYSEPVSPLFHSADGCEKLDVCARAGVPVVYMPYCMRGGTAPITFGGAMVQSMAEILSGLVIHQSCVPGAPFIMGCMPSVFDMKTTIGSYGAAEFHHGVLVSSEMADYFGLPFYGTGGTTDAGTLDFQAGAESMMCFISSMAGKINFVHDVGTFCHNVVLSPEFLVMCNDMIDSLRIFKQKIDFSYEDYRFELIKEIGPSGHYLTHDDTIANFRSINYSKFFTRDISYNTPNNIAEKIRKETRKLIERFTPPEYSDAQTEAIRSAEARWERSLL